MSQSTRSVAATANRWLRSARISRGAASSSLFAGTDRDGDTILKSLQERNLVFSRPPKRSFSSEANNIPKKQQQDRRNPSDVFELKDEDYDSDDSDYDDYNEAEEMPWKLLLEHPARASWRSSDPRPPDIAVQAQTGVLNAGAVTAKQVRRCYTDIVASHKALALRRERERRRMLNGTPYTRRAQQRDEACLPVIYGRLETLSFLKSRLAPNFAITKRVLEETQSLLKGSWKPKRIIDMGIGVGCASAAALEVFRQDIEWVHGIDSSRCMRECSKSFLEEIMEETAKQRTERVNPPRLTLSGSIAAESSSGTFDMALMTYTASELPQVNSTLAAAALLWQKLAHNGVLVLIEPGTPDGFNTIRAVRNMLLDCAPPNGESAEESFDDEDSPPVGQCHIIAPCTHNGICPMERLQRTFLRQANPQTQMEYVPQDDSLDEDYDSDDDEWITMSNFQELHGSEDDEDDTPHKKGRSATTDQTERLGRRFCSFVQTMSSGGRLKKGEKFSYLVAQKRCSSDDDSDNENENGGSFQNERLRDLLANVYEANEDPTTNQRELEAQQRRVQNLFEQAKALETKYLDSEEDELGLEFLQGDINRASFGRVIRAPIKKRGHVYIDYCAAPGRLMRSRITKSLDYRVAPGLYTAARKTRWGGLWPDVAPPPHPDDDDEEDDDDDEF